MNFIERIKGGIIVSCQALEGEPLCVPGYMARMALAAEMGGAVGIRANSPEDIKSIKQTVGIPVIGIWKVTYDNSDVYITPGVKEVMAVAEAGADIVAVDATNRLNYEGVNAWELIKACRQLSDIPLMADVSTLDEGLNAARLGYDLISTTLSGYTPYSPKLKTPDFNLLKALVNLAGVPVLAEGRIWTPEEAAQAFHLGAHAVVIGGAITRPQLITKRFVEYACAEVRTV